MARVSPSPLLFILVWGSIVSALYPNSFAATFSSATAPSTVTIVRLDSIMAPSRLRAVGNGVNVVYRRPQISCHRSVLVRSSSASSTVSFSADARSDPEPYPDLAPSAALIVRYDGADHDLGECGALLCAEPVFDRDSYRHTARLILIATRPQLPITRFGPNLYHRMLYLLEAHHYHQAVVVIEADDTDHGAVLAALDFHPAVTFEKIFSRDGTLTDIRLWTRMLPEPSLRLSSSSSLIPTLPPAASSSSEDATGVVLRPARYADAEAIRSIYAPYVKWSAISFEQRCPSANEIRARMGDFTLPWIVAVADGRGHDPPDHDVIGFCYASKLWNYERIVMTSIYISPDGQGQGLGQRLYRDLFARLRQQSVTAVIVAIDPMNHASIHLHRKVGFRPAGTIEAIGRKFDQWLPRLFMQYHL